ncbi:methyltransferase [Amphritea pacifica]|uniref:Class I SAM-dependent methyltransferase n=1 Tax=Amphritea pacifica TaxID=2811233 RepID=A0ABS2WBU5_9GAMM|nr:methyltransferase [Amphritea pacifica]MBN0989192.1 class I SAM-dependent methyltransferase [Amphritea pacifica]MBN1008577.1 class I SAM-dependent methyltransferase [Amphritea pacifica]
MTDTAFSLLKPELDSAAGIALWIADENLLNQTSRVNPAVTVISNRFDLCQQLNVAGWNSQFSDFDFSPYENHSVDKIIYRISKEKPVVHHVINQAIRILKPGGTLCISGLKNEGIKTYLDKARKLFAGQMEQSKSDKNTWMGVLTSPGAPDTELLEDQDYTRLREVAADENFSYISKPGVYGWNKIDKGSAFLVAELPRFIERLPSPPQTALDLGCGYGYLSLNCSPRDCRLTATDNNAGALQACRENFKQQGIDAEVVAADCAEGVAARFPLIVCNPPFHQGFGIEGDMTDRFLEAARKHLQTDGVACFVVNLHIPLERKAQKRFSTVETIADNGSFKLILLAQPK